MIMFAVILGFPAVPWVIVGAIKLLQAYQTIREAFEFVAGVKTAQ